MPSKPPARPLQRRLSIKFAKLMRWLHIYLSMFSLAVVLFFSVTGITLNHPGLVLQRSREQSRVAGRNQARVAVHSQRRPRRPMPGDRDRQVSKLEIVEHLRNAIRFVAPWPIFGSTRANASSRSRGPAMRPTPSSTAKQAITG